MTDSKKDFYRLDGRVAIITGAGMGIGAAIARVLAQYGADTVIAARTVADVERVATSISAETGRRCLAVQTDVKEEAQIINLVQRTVDELGRVDILVNSAGGTTMMPFANLTTELWESDFDLNIRSSYIATREVGKHFRAQGSGAIVNISSGAGIDGMMGGAHYASAKAALNMFTRVAAAEWGPYGIRINCVAPGVIESERAMAAMKMPDIAPGAAPTEKQLRSAAVAKAVSGFLTSMAAQTPLRRNGTPEEIANAVHFLVSDASSYLTGQTIAVDGGPKLVGIPGS